MRNANDVTKKTTSRPDREMTAANRLPIVDPVAISREIGFETRLAITHERTIEIVAKEIDHTRNIDLAREIDLAKKIGLARDITPAKEIALATGMIGKIEIPIQKRTTRKIEIGH